MSGKRGRRIMLTTLMGSAIAMPLGARAAEAAQQVRPSLTVSARTAAVGTWVDYTVQGTPAKAAWGQRVRVLVRGRDGWIPIGTMQFDRAGMAHGRVTGKEPGVGSYQARVLTPAGRVTSQSAIVSIIWTSTP